MSKFDSSKYWLGVYIFFVLVIISFLIEVIQVKEIDINSGQIRSRIFVLGILLEEHIQKTSFSKLIDKFSLKKEPPIWHRASYKAHSLLGTRYECQKYGEAGACCENLVAFFEVESFSLEKQKQRVKEFFCYLQNGDIKEMNDQMFKMMENPKRKTK